MPGAGPSASAAAEGLPVQVLERTESTPAGAANALPAGANRPATGAPPGVTVTLP